MTPRLLVVGVPGSLREGSRTRAAVEVALRGAEAAGAETRLADLREYDLPLCDGTGELARYHAGLLELRKLLTRARGVVLGTPEYHGGPSGVLKNALDLMGFPEFEGKVLGLLAVSEGPGGGRHALDALAHVGQALHAWVLPARVAVLTPNPGADNDVRPIERGGASGHARPS